MAKIESTVTIARPVEEVFGFLLALDENLLKTDSGVESVVRTPDGPPGPGTTFRIRQKTLGRVTESTTRLTAVEPDRRIEWDAKVGPMRPHAAFTFQATNGGTIVTFRADPNPAGPFKLLSPLFVRIGRRVWNDRLRRIKTAIESSTGTRA